MSDEKELTRTHPLGELQSAGIQSSEPFASVDTFAGKIHLKWVPDGAVSSLGLMPFFIEFLKTSGLFDRWVEDCPLVYSSANAPKKRDVLGTILLAVLAGQWRMDEAASESQLRAVAGRAVGIGRGHDGKAVVWASGRRQSGLQPEPA